MDDFASSLVSPARPISPSGPAGPRWDLFCRVVDNFGDIGVTWRLARDLAARGCRVRLIVDDGRALVWMAPQGDALSAGVEVLPWPGPAAPGDVVVEAFGCELPPAFVRAMAAARPAAPLWINLEYLSAEAYVERSHGLPSPQRDGQTRWFFFPGFTAPTGGLLREPGLRAEQAAFDSAAWLAARGWQARPGEQTVSLFCYANPALPALLQWLARRPTLLFVTPGPAQQQVPATLPGVRQVRLPWLSQPDYDRLLWSCDLNFVRGEDSLVRALWAGRPFVWQAYPQHDGAHHAKVDALLERLALPAAAAALWRDWSAAAPLPAAAGDRGAAWPALPPDAAWCQATQRARDAQRALPDLASQLLAFGAARGLRRTMVGC